MSSPQHKYHAPDQVIPMSPSLDEEKAILLKAETIDNRVPQDELAPRRHNIRRVLSVCLRLVLLVVAVTYGLVYALSASSVWKHRSVHQGDLKHTVSTYTELDEHQFPPYPPRPPHAPPHRGPPPAFPPPPPPFGHGPKAIECLDISDAQSAVNLSLTLHHVGEPVHLLPSLNNADISIIVDEKDQADQKAALSHHRHHEQAPSSDMPPPPPPPPGSRFPGPPHFPHGHGKPQTLMVSVKRVSNKHGEGESSFFTSADYEAGDHVDIADGEKQKKEKVFICSLALPFGQVGLGLFHQPPPPQKHDEQGKRPCPKMAKMRQTLSAFANDDEQRATADRKQHEAFPDVSLEIHRQADEPFTLTSAKSGWRPPPPPPPPFPGHHHGPHRQDMPHGLPWDAEKHAKAVHNGKHRQAKGIVVVVTTIRKKMGCAGRGLMQKMGF